MVLLHAVRVVIRADSHPLRQSLFETLRQDRRAVRVAHALHQRLRPTWLAGALVSAYGLKSLIGIGAPRGGDGSILAVAVFANARRQIGRVAGWLDAGQVEEVAIGIALHRVPEHAAALLRLCVPPRRLLQSLRVINTVGTRHGFLVACRVASTIACYARARDILQRRRYRAVLVSSTSNPEEVAFTTAAQRLGVPTIFISHAYANTVSPPLDFTLSILEGEAAVAAHERIGPISGAVFLAGLEGESAPLDATRLCAREPVIGIFPPKIVSWATFNAVVDDCRTRFGARQILIRWHPNMIGRPRLGDIVRDAAIVETAPADTLADVAKRCDWVVASLDSNVHLPVLKLGVPTIAIAGFRDTSGAAADLYGFEENRIVFPPVPSLRDLQLDAAVAFYSDGWTDRFGRYDAAYLSPAGQVEADARAALRQALAGTGG